MASPKDQDRFPWVLDRFPIITECDSDPGFDIAMERGSLLPDMVSFAVDTHGIPMQLDPALMTASLQLMKQLLEKYRQVESLITDVTQSRDLVRDTEGGKE